MKKWMIALFMCSILIAGCGDTSQKKDSSNQEEVPTMIEAALDVPEKAEIGDEISLAVTVTQGKDFVNDATEVKFEIWQEGLKNNSEKVEANYSENGIYTIGYSFPENGIYHVQSHVTARNMHTMPEKTIQIGDVEAQHEHAEGADNKHAEGTDEHSHHESDVSIHLNTPEHVNKNESTALSVHLEKEQQPLTKANVRLEIFQDESNPAWVDTEEAAKGEYKATYQFPTDGKYTVRIHVQNDEGLHEHTEIEVNVH